MRNGAMKEARTQITVPKTGCGEPSRTSEVLKEGYNPQCVRLSKMCVGGGGCCHL